MSKRTDKTRLIFSQVLGKILKELRENSEKSQEELGRLSDVNRITLGKWENGKVVPDIFDLYNTIREICPSQAFFWEKVECNFEPIFTEMDRAADKGKFEDYLRRSKKQKPSSPR